MFCAVMGQRTYYYENREKKRVQKKSYIPLLMELVLRDIKIKYRRSVLGVLWTVLNPLLMMLVLYLVFSRLFRFEIENYAIYVMSGQVLFNYFQSATTDGMMAVIGNAALIKKIFIPKYMLVLAKILSCGVNLIASFAALMLVMLITGEAIPLVSLLSVGVMCLMMVFSLGIGLMLAAVTVKFRDVIHLYSVVCMLLFYLTPVIYPLSILPDYMKRAVYFNPLTQMIQMFRSLLIDGRVPDLGQTVYCTAAAVISLLIGIAVFRWREKKFILDI